MRGRHRSHSAGRRPRWRVLLHLPEDAHFVDRGLSRLIRACLQELHPDHHAFAAGRLQPLLAGGLILTGYRSLKATSTREPSPPYGLRSLL